MRNRTVLRAACAAAAAAFLIACGAGTTPDSTASPTSGPTFTTTLDSPAATSASAAPKTPAAVAKPTITDGIWQVPEDVKPGTYKTTVPADSYNCYWEVMKDFSGDIDSIMSNGNQDGGKQVVLLIPKTAKGLEVSGCGTWTKIK